MNKGFKNFSLSFFKTTIIEMAYTSGNHINQNNKSSKINSKIIIIPLTHWINLDIKYSFLYKHEFAMIIRINDLGNIVN